ncbi:hypothetical protein TEPIDINF_002422 [Tepidibacillus infernus]|uniref:hypothetical protein n=1 Tax=Tepidibacillus infernus TaxID=1806172 RepID=UPI003B6CBF4F
MKDNSVIIEKDWKLIQSKYEPNNASYYESLFALSNGKIGIRNTIEFDSIYSIPGFFMSNIYDRTIQFTSEIVNLPNWLPIKFQIEDSSPINFDDVEINEFYRELNYKKATVFTKIIFTDSQKRKTKIEWETLIHAKYLELSLLWGNVTPINYSNRINICSYIDARIGNSYLGGFNSNIQTYHYQKEHQKLDELLGLILEGNTFAKNERIIIASKLNCYNKKKWFSVNERNRVGECQVIYVEEGKKVDFHKIAFIKSNINREEFELEYKKYLNKNISSLIDEHLQIWNKYWEEYDVRIGNKEYQSTIRFNLFHLIQSINHFSHSQNTPARGLTSEYHSGHFFFNTEFFKLPFWSLVNPSIARSYLMFRYDTLSNAKRHAKETGFEGARYPEETDFDGLLAAPWEIFDLINNEKFYEWSGKEKYFLSGAVLYGLYTYHSLTNDDDFMWNYGLELIIQCAKFAKSLFTWDESIHKYVINSVMGPDEYHYHVNNNYFTNFIMKWTLTYASKTLKNFREKNVNKFNDIAKKQNFQNSEIEYWEDIASLVYFPDYKEKILQQHDGYFDLPDNIVSSWDPNGRPALSVSDRKKANLLKSFNTRLIKEADIVLMLSLFSKYFTKEIKQKSFEFYTKRIVHESSLSASPHGLVASEIGLYDQATYFLKLASRFNLDYLPKENYRNGIHLAAYAGAWQILVHGIAGISFEEDLIIVKPRITNDLGYLEFNIKWRGAKLSFTFNENDLIVNIKESNGQEISLKILDDYYKVNDLKNTVKVNINMKVNEEG